MGATRTVGPRSPEAVPPANWELPTWVKDGYEKEEMAVLCERVQGVPFLLTGRRPQAGQRLYMNASAGVGGGGSPRAHHLNLHISAMLKAFLKFKAEKQAEVEWRQESLFSEGFATPSRMNSRERSPGIEYVSWAEVQSFLQMAEQALKVRTATNEALSKELKEAKSEKCQVEKTSSAAQEESSFLAESMAELMQERAALREALERAQREKEYLVQENALLRQELLDGAALGEESSAALHLFARQGEDLREAQQRNAQLENDNVQLQARVSALERANTAQATAMLSCLEESERTRLQQLTISICESPVGPLAGGRHRASEFTDDSSAGAGGDGGGYADAYAELGSDGSYVSCITPLTTGSGGGQSGSIFHSPDTSPDCAQQQQRRQQQQAQSQRQPSRQHSSSGKRDNFSCS